MDFTCNIDIYRTYGAVMRIVDFDDEDSLICTVCGQSLGTGGGGGPSSCSLGGAFPEERSLVHKASESKIKRSWSSKLLFFLPLSINV